MSAMYERTTDSGWTVTAYPEEGLPTFKIIAISPDRKRFIHRAKSTEAELATFSPEASWANR